MARSLSISLSRTYTHTSATASVLGTAVVLDSTNQRAHIIGESPNASVLDWASKLTEEREKSQAYQDIQDRVLQAMQGEVLVCLLFPLDKTWLMFAAVIFLARSLALSASLSNTHALSNTHTYTHTHTHRVAITCVNTHAIYILTYILKCRNSVAY